MIAQNIKQHIKNVLLGKTSPKYVTKLVCIVSSEGALYVILPYDYQAAAAATFWTHTGP